MRVVYLHQYFCTPQGAYSTRVYEFARRWVDAGHAVTVVTCAYDKSDLIPDGLLTRLHIEGIDVRLINIAVSNKHSFARRILGFLLYAVIASWYAVRLPADVVIASSGPLTVALPGLLARYLRRRALVFEVRDIWPDGAIELGVLRNRWAIWFSRWLAAQTYRRAGAVVALSTGMRDWILQRHQVRRIEVIPNSSDNALFGTAQGWAGPEWVEGRHVLVNTGTMGTVDHCGQLVELASELQARGRNDIQVVLIGDGKERRQLEARAQELRLKNVRFLGMRPKTEVVLWLSRARGAFLTTRDTPLMDTCSPNKLFDAFSAGVPVIQVTQGWIRELLASEQCGQTVPRDDAMAMADAVEKLCDDDGFRERQSANARRVAHSLFDRDLLSEKYMAMLEDLAADRVPRQSEPETVLIPSRPQPVPSRGTAAATAAAGQRKP